MSHRQLTAFLATTAILAFMGQWRTLPAASADSPKDSSDFPKIGVAFLHKHCLDCHGEKVQKGELSFHTYRDDASLLKDRKVWQSILKMVSSGEMPPQGRPRPALADVEAFVQSAQGVFAKADRQIRDPGQVTIR